MSPHFEEFTSPTDQDVEEIKSRFHADRNRTNRNLELELEGSVKRVERVEQNVNENEMLCSGNASSVERSSVSSSIETESISSRFASIRKKKESTPSSTSSNSSLEYTVQFEPGSIGLKIEPVVKSGNKEFGCRVMKFVDTASPSQAKKSGKIEIGHVLTAINGRNVTSKSYADIVKQLADCKSQGKSITFRIPRIPALNISQTPSSESSSPMVGELSADSPLLVKSLPVKHDMIRPSPSTPGSCSSTMFSPSFVKKMTQTTVKDRNVFLGSNKKQVKTVSDVLSNVMKNIIPDTNDSTSSFTTSTLSKRISEALIGTHSVHFDETVQMKQKPHSVNMK